MKRIVWVFLFVAVCAGIGNTQNTTKPALVFVIHGPTIVAFYPHFSQKEIDNGEGDAAAMDDFGFYASQVAGRLKKAGIEFLPKETRSFKVRVGARVRHFPGGKIDIGYYFIAPGKEPHVEYGVMTDIDLLDAARKYFSIAIR